MQNKPYESFCIASIQNAKMGGRNALSPSKVITKWLYDVFSNTVPVGRPDLTMSNVAHIFNVF